MLVLLSIILILVIIILLVLLRYVVSTKPEPPPPPGTGYTIPNQLDATGLATQFQVRLAGTPSDGSAAPSTIPNEVIWIDHGDELLVHLDGTVTQIVGSTVLVSLDLECDQTGRTPLVVAFSLGTDASGGLVAATDAYPRGNGILAARWGAVVQAAAWSALLSLSNDHATERGLSPRGLAISGGYLQLIAGNALTLK